MVLIVSPLMISDGKLFCVLICSVYIFFSEKVYSNILLIPYWIICVFFSINFWGFLLPVLSAGKSFKSLSWGNYSAYFICFTALRDHSFIVFMSSVCKTFVLFIFSKLGDFFVCLFVSDRRVNMVPDTSYWLEAEAHICFALF